MPLTLYGLSGSPYVWRVQLALEHKGLPFELKQLSYDAGDFGSEQLRALNPRRRVPVLVDDDFVLYESAAIVEYLEERFAGTTPLFGADARQRALQRRLVREIDQYVAAAIENLVESVLFTPQERWSDERIANAYRGIGRELALWEVLAGEPWLAGTLSAADFALFPLVALVQRIARRKAPPGDVELTGPRIGTWTHAMTALPLVQKTWPPHWRA